MSMLSRSLPQTSHFLKATTPRSLSPTSRLRQPFLRSPAQHSLSQSRSFHSSPRSLFARTPPATMATYKEFLCILPDKPGAHEKRLEVRPTHLENVKPLVAAGKVVDGGAMFNTAHPQPGETPSFKGSMIIYAVESEEEVWKLIKDDIYVKADVWDLEKAQVIPFKSAIRG
ncbi:hypothetical protein BDW69DRAFT_79798 [Aspergillus filifer]